jgi:branched-chain amino acid transport system substrate-binding protein
MKKLILVSLILLVFVSFASIGCQSAPSAPSSSAATKAAQTTQAASSQAKTLNVGVIFGMTGPGSESAAGWRDGVLLARDWINNKGGITVNGQKYIINCIVEDDKMSPAGAIAAANKLVFQDKVSFIVGGVIPAINDATISVTDPNKVLFNIGKNGAVFADKPFTFVASAGFVAPVPAIYASMKELYPSIKTIGFMMEDESGGRAVAGASQGMAKAQGLTTLEPIVHPWESTEYSPEWTKLIAQKPDAVDVGLKTPPNLANCVKQGRQMGYKGPMFGAVGGSVQLMLNMIGPQYATDFIWPAYDPYDANVPQNVVMVRDLWEKTYNSKASKDGVDHFNDLWELAQAIEKAQSLDPAVVAKTWESMASMETTTGTAKIGGAKTFGANRMVFNPQGLIRLQNGKPETLKWVDTYMP